MRTVPRLTLALALFPPLAASSLASAGTGPAPLRAAAPACTIAAETGSAHARLPLSFEANTGQYADDVRFLARGNGYALWLTPGEAVLSLAAPAQGARAGDAVPRQDHALRMQVVNANLEARTDGEERLPGVVNHYRGSDPARWRTGVPTFARVRYSSVYPGIDLVYYGREGRLEYDFEVGPGADPSLIALRFAGAGSLRLAEDGSLVLGIAGRELRWDAPALYQAVDGRHVPVAGSYRLLADASAGAHAVGFTVASYDRTRPLVIDPVLAYSTFLGGTDDDHAFKVAVDESNHAYATGFTYSADFPVANAAQAVLAGSQDVFVTKMDKTGTALVYSTFLGGSAFEVGRGITLDGSRNAYLTGNTSSTDFPVTPGAYDTVHNGNNDVFVVKLDSAGQIVYGTYVGSDGNEQGEDIAVENGRAYVAGYTDDSSFPTTMGAYDTAYNGGAFDGFVFRLGPAGAVLSYSTFLGGSSYDYVYAITLSGDEAYVTGRTTSANFPVLAGYDMVYNNAGDAFVTHLAGGGGALVASTFLGGTGSDTAYDITLGAAGHAFVTGGTASANYPTTAGAYDVALAGASDVFVTKLNGALAALTYSTYIGGDGNESGRGIAANAFAGALVAGITDSVNFPTVNPTQAAFGGGALDAFALRVTPTGDGINFSTYLGGPGYDLGYDLALDGCGQAYVVGKAGDGFPTTTGAFDTSWNGQGDGYVVKIQP
jgi:hypothetical protein